MKAPLLQSEKDDRFTYCGYHPSMDYDSDRDDSTDSGELLTRGRTQSNFRVTQGLLVVLPAGLLGLFLAMGMEAVPKIGFQAFLSSMLPILVGMLIILTLWLTRPIYFARNHRIAEAVLLEASLLRDKAPESDYRDYYIQAFSQLERIGQIRMAARLPRPVNTSPAISRAQAWKL